MALIDNLIKVSITQETLGVAQASFGIPLIMGLTDPSGWGQDVVRIYSAPAELLNDGFESTSPEYLAAVAMYSQTTTPTEFAVGKRSSNPIASDFTAIFAQNNTPYGIVLAGLPESDIIPAAQAVEALTKFLIVSTNDSAVPTQGTGDIASQLQELGLKRTGLVWTSANQNGVLEAAWMGSQLPQTPGSNNWAYKSLSGVSTDNISATMQNVLYGIPVAGVAGKNVNCYQAIAGANVTFPGMACGGQYFDITIGIDWLTANIQTSIYQQLSGALKVPYTTAGVTLLMNGINQVLQLGAANGLLDPNDVEYPIYVRADSVDSMSITQRANRISPTIYFGGRLQGAIDSVAVSGSVTV